MYLRPTLRMQLSEIWESLHVKKHFGGDTFQPVTHRLLDSLVVECERSRVQSPVKNRVIPKTL